MPRALDTGLEVCKQRSRADEHSDLEQVRVVATDNTERRISQWASPLRVMIESDQPILVLASTPGINVARSRILSHGSSAPLRKQPEGGRELGQ